MAIELECKVRVDSHEAVREAIQAAGGAYIGRVLENNRLFDDVRGHLRESGRGLRVRAVKILDGKGPRATLTYKGPRVEGTYKQREEVELAISDAAAMGKVLAALGYSEQVVFEKRRESWTLDPCRIELDEVPRLGVFVEVEGPDESAIRSALASIGLADAASIHESYVELVASLLGGDAARPLVLTFEQAARASG